ncbi:hypothetical protein K0M31_003745 [Melipona bicolor]|uniref:Uncharacterized protein n=1 Tax=Melipona bicolor TaxID=60889 RepID=A0AA40FXX5_9HYME|nr:hypothetical protein K0M31_003745 [Melipona bicolor]
MLDQSNSDSSHNCKLRRVKKDVNESARAILPTGTPCEAKSSPGKGESWQVVTIERASCKEGCFSRTRLVQSGAPQGGEEPPS